jgi:hypothetical protein
VALQSDDCKHPVELVAVNGCGRRWIAETFDIDSHSWDRYNPAKRRGEFHLLRRDDDARNSGVLVLDEIVCLVDLLDPLPNGDLSADSFHQERISRFMQRNDDRISDLANFVYVSRVSGA